MARMTTKLRLPRGAEEDLGIRIEALARELISFQPQVVSDTCDEWARSSAFWPAVAEILPIARDYQRVADTPQVTGRGTATECVARIAHRGWPATRIAPMGYEAVEFILNNHTKGDAEVIRGLEMIEAGKSPKAQRREVPPPTGKPMAMAFDLCREPARFPEAASKIAMYLAMVERFHGRDEAQFQAGQLAAVANGVAVEALRPWTGKVAA